MGEEEGWLPLALALALAARETELRVEVQVSSPKRTAWQLVPPLRGTLSSDWRPVVPLQSKAGWCSRRPTPWPMRLPPSWLGLLPSC